MEHVYIIFLLLIAAFGKNVGGDVSSFVFMSSSGPPTQQVAAGECSVEDELKSLGLSGVALDTVLRKPQASRSSYILNVRQYLEWYENNREPYITCHGDESVRNYCLFLSKSYQPSSLWSKSSYVKDHLAYVFGCDRKGWHATKSFCRKMNEGYEPKKAKALTVEDLEEFWSDDAEHLTNHGLLRKVLSIACHFAGDRSKEVVSLLKSEVTIELQRKEVSFTTSRSKGDKMKQSHLIISKNGCDKAALFQLYVTKVRESVQNFDGPCRFYLQVESKTGRFKNQPVGKNFITEVFKYIAAYAGKNPDQYTSHGGRAGSITTMVDNGAPLPLILDHANLKSEHVYNRYVRGSEKRQREIASFLVPKGPVSEPEVKGEPPVKKQKIVFQNCTFTNCKVGESLDSENEPN